MLGCQAPLGPTSPPWGQSVEEEHYKAVPVSQRHPRVATYYKQQMITRKQYIWVWKKQQDEAEVVSFIGTTLP